jgi:glycosyltransferase involved in cell wall biosynthesis
MTAAGALDTVAISAAPARALRIVSVCRTFPTPADASGGIFVLNRVAAMAKLADVSALQPIPYCPGLNPLPEWGRAPGHDAYGVSIAHAPMFYLPKVLKSLDASWLARAVAPVIKRLHAERKLDLIDAHFGYPEGVGCLAVARTLGIPAFITIRGFETEYVDRPRVGTALIEALRRADGVIAVSHSLRDLAIRHGVRAERVRVIHNAIDREVFHAGDREASRLHLGIAPDTRLIVSVGHLISRKRHHVLIDAIRRLAATGDPVTLAIVGAPLFEPDYPSELEAQVAKLRLGERVRFVGNLPPEEVVHWLRAANVFGLATAREGCCNAVLEALAAGAPVVTTPVGDNAHFVAEGVNGFLAPVDDAPALADALRKALDVPDWSREDISDRLFAQVRSWDRTAREVLDFFTERLHVGAVAAHAAP